MLEKLSSLPHTIAAFVVVISVIVFIHEFGHYIVAKACGVRITAFSLGFGKEIFGWNDKSGTRWKVSLLPLGGYVKMFGDSSEASNPDVNALEAMSEADKKRAFHFKPLYQKALIVAAGPAFNFLLTIGIFTYFILSNGLPSIEPVVGKIMEKSAAQEAGLQVGDRINMVNDKQVHSFNDISYYISTNLGTPVTLSVQREAENLQITLTPKNVEDDDGLGNKVSRPLIGIGSGKIEYKDVGLLGAIKAATVRTYMFCKINLQSIGQLIIGERSPKDLRGTVGVAQISGQAASKGAETLILMIANLSAGIGLMNLLPIPVLDGGHLVFYTIEAIFRRPLAIKAQEWSFRIGFSLLAMLMAYTLMNDVRRLIS
jgi:regulator of sigma E protease